MPPRPALSRISAPWQRNEGDDPATACFIDELRAANDGFAQI